MVDLSKSSIFCDLAAAFIKIVFICSTGRSAISASKRPNKFFDPDQNEPVAGISLIGKTICL